jgi:hypothetical protein
LWSQRRDWSGPRSTIWPRKSGICGAPLRLAVLRARAP